MHNHRPCRAVEARWFQESKFTPLVKCLPWMASPRAAKLWYRRLAPRLFHVVDLYRHATGTYHASLHEVDLRSLTVADRRLQKASGYYECSPHMLRDLPGVLLMELLYHAGHAEVVHVYQGTSPTLASQARLDSYAARMSCAS